MIFNFSIVVVHIVEFHSFFPFLIKYYNIMFIILIRSGLTDRPTGLTLLFSCSLYFFPYSRLSSYLLRLFLYLFFSVWDNTRA